MGFAEITPRENVMTLLRSGYVFAASGKNYELPAPNGAGNVLFCRKRKGR